MVRTKFKCKENSDLNKKEGHGSTAWWERKPTDQLLQCVRTHSIRFTECGMHRTTEWLDQGKPDPIATADVGLELPVRDV